MAEENASHQEEPKRFRDSEAVKIFRDIFFTTGLMTTLGGVAYAAIGWNHKRKNPAIDIQSEVKDGLMTGAKDALFIAPLVAIVNNWRRSRRKEEQQNPVTQPQQTSVALSATAPALPEAQPDASLSYRARIDAERQAPQAQTTLQH